MPRPRKIPLRPLTAHERATVAQVARSDAERADRAVRRQRERERRHALGGSGGYTRTSLPRPRRPRYQLPLPNGYVHAI